MISEKRKRRRRAYLKQRIYGVLLLLCGGVYIYEAVKFPPEDCTMAVIMIFLGLYSLFGRKLIFDE